MTEFEFTRDQKLHCLGWIAGILHREQDDKGIEEVEAVFSIYVRMYHFDNYARGGVAMVYRFPELVESVEMVRSGYLTVRGSSEYDRLNTLIRWIQTYKLNVA